VPPPEARRFVFCHPSSPVAVHPFAYRQIREIRFIAFADRI